MVYFVHSMKNSSGGHKKTIMTSDEIGGEPYIMALENISRIEYHARSDDTIGLIYIFTVIPHHYTVKYISTILLYFK